MSVITPSALNQTIHHQSLLAFLLVRAPRHLRMSTARLREVLNAGHRDKGPPAADGTLSIAAESSEAAEVATRRSAVDYVATTSTYLEDETEGTLHNTPSHT